MPELNVGINGRNATKGAKDVNSALDSIGNKSRSLISTAINPLTVAIGGIASYQTVSGLINSADKFTTIAAQLEYVTGSSLEAEEAQRLLYEMSQNTGTSLTANSDALVRLSQAQEMMGTTTEENVEILGGLNALMLKTGTSGVQASSAMLQLTQALSSGVLAGDEFKSISENAPALMKAFAEALGVPRGELKGMAEEGKITTEIMTGALRTIASEAGTSFEGLPKTAESGWQRVVNAFQTAWDRINDKTGIMGFLFDALIELSEWIEENSPTFTVWIENLVNSMRESWPEIKEGISEIGVKIQDLWNKVAVALPSMETFFRNFTEIVNITATAIKGLVTAMQWVMDNWGKVQSFLQYATLTGAASSVMAKEGPGAAYTEGSPGIDSLTSGHSASPVSSGSSEVNINVNQNVSRSDIVNIASEMQLQSSRE